MNMDSIHFEGPDFLLNASELDEIFLQHLKDCGCSGDASHAVNYVIEHYSITGDEKDCQNYLKGYGAWELEELQDHKENLRRLVWLAGADLDEQGEAYFSTY